MAVRAELIGSSSWAAALRQELCARNREYACLNALTHQQSIGASPAICFGPSADGTQHGNFLPATYQAILKNDNWRRRLEKPHTSALHAFPRDGQKRRELDSGTSSDALLMNIFCFPATLKQDLVVKLLGVEAPAPPEFGYRARVPLLNGRTDRTEVDMRIADVLVEAKLTEADFQKKPRSVLATYRDFEEVFGAGGLTSDGGFCHSYQLIRNVLAAHATGCSFCVIMDERRPDLREAWYAVMRSVQPHHLRMRCRMLTWQELAGAVPAKLRIFLRQKYGI